MVTWEINERSAYRTEPLTVLQTCLKMICLLGPLKMMICLSSAVSASNLFVFGEFRWIFISDDNWLRRNRPPIRRGFSVRAYAGVTARCPRVVASGTSTDFLQKNLDVYIYGKYTFQFDNGFICDFDSPAHLFLGLDNRRLSAIWNAPNLSKELRYGSVNAVIFVRQKHVLPLCRQISMCST